MDQQPTDSRGADKPAKYQSLRGMRDILPEDVPYYRLVEETFFQVARSHGFAELRTPVMEPTELYARTSGETSDIVGKEMYSFTDRSDHAVSLRPEGTAGVARAYIQHGFASRPQPVKLCYLANMYRYERPQSGRYREHTQFGFEAFGSSDPATDAQIILAGWQVFQKLGLKDVTVQVNSIGKTESRRAIRQAIVDALTPLQDQLSEDAQRQLRDNPLRILDSKDPQTMAVVEHIPPLIDQLTEADREHFTAVLEYLDQVGVTYELNPRLVRGLDYYTRTVFEFWGPDGAATTLSAGGRYDHLIKQLGGPDTPGIGMGNGVDRIVDLLKAGQGVRPPEQQPQVFVIQLGDVAKKISFELIDQLTADGLCLSSASGKDSIRAQLKAADRSGAPLALIIGQKEAMEGSIIIRDMASGMQEIVPLKEVLAQVKSRIPSAVTTRQSGS